MTEPALPVVAPGQAVIVFDGSCVLCNGWVKFLLRHDRAGRYRFASMQGKHGRALLQSHGLDPDDPTSFLLADTQGMHTDSDAIVRVLTGLGSVWRLAALAGVLPQRWRDGLYRAVARRRYRWFGTTACTIPTPAQRARFLD